ncbi:MAG: hypothetical protein H3C26_03735 [Rhodocyclaceae bacterium]|nr:hypothetical protein [Rhodocyclaceae bacterium]
MKTRLPALLATAALSAGAAAAAPSTAVADRHADAAVAVPRPPSVAAALRPPRPLNDPFAVSPQLYERRGPRFSGLPGASVLDLQRRVRVKALMATAGGGMAQLLVNGRDALTVMHKEVVDLGDLGIYEVQIGRAGVALSEPGASDAAGGKKVVLR